MLNEYVYCPRLFHLEYVQGEWADSGDTEDGRFQHRRADRAGGAFPAAPEAEPTDQIHARSVLLSAPGEGLLARIDLLEGEGQDVTPVDYKRGSAPEIPEGAWPPERVQICAQALILRENGYRCTRGVLYFAAERRRVEVLIDEALIAQTRQAVREALAVAARTESPPPLVDSPKCPRCSLVGICLPDETNLLREPTLAEVRRLIPARDDALPLYVHTQGARVGVQANRVVVTDRKEVLHEGRLLDTSQVCLVGNVQATTQAVRALCEQGIPLVYLSYGHRFCGVTHGMTHKHVDLRIAQYEAARAPDRALRLACRFVAAKIRNSRTLVRRNHPAPGDALRTLKRLADRATRASSLPSLLGIEGSAARVYFEQFGGLLRPPGEQASLGFAMEGRNRRPPLDPVNALLSLAYALLAKDWTVTLVGVGFDPYLGFFHQPRYGKPALALDLMEEFRPLIADSVVITAINTGEVSASDFIRRGPAVALRDPGRRRFVQAYERRMDSLITHPLFGYRISYRRLLEVQARLLARHLSGEIADYPGFRTR